MHYGYLSLLAILLAVVIGFWRDLNVGILAMGLAFLLGSFGAGLTPIQIIAFWPTKLFVTLIGVSLLFSMARCNKTLDRVAALSIAAAQGNGPLIPWIFFFLAAGFAAIGPGNIAVVAILSPIAMAVAAETRTPSILMAAMLIGGSNAGGMSPIAPTGIIGINLSQQYLNVDTSFTTWAAMSLSAFVWCFLLYFYYGGLRLQKRKTVRKENSVALNRENKLTLFAMAFLIIVVAVFHWDLGLSAFLAASILLVFKAADEKSSIAGIPWSALILVAGTGTLIEVSAQLGGIDLLTDLFKTFMTESTAVSLIGVISGLMTFFASASGVVMPTLIRTLPGLLSQFHFLSAPIMVASIVAGGHLVTTGPFTTLGALALAALPPEQNRQKFLRAQLLTSLAGIVFTFLWFFLLFKLPFFAV